MLRQKPNFAVNLAEMLKEVTIHFCLFYEFHFSNIFTFWYVTMEWIETNWLCKNRKEVRSSEASILINLVLDCVKHSFPCDFPCILSIYLKCIAVLNLWSNSLKITCDGVTSSVNLQIMLPCFLSLVQKSYISSHHFDKQLILWKCFENLGKFLKKSTIRQISSPSL